MEDVVKMLQIGMDSSDIGASPIDHNLQAAGLEKEGDERRYSGCYCEASSVDQLIRCHGRDCKIVWVCLFLLCEIRPR